MTRPRQQGEQEMVEGLVGAYREGLFPMSDPRTGRIDWYRPDPRAVLGLRADQEEFHVSRSLRKRVRSAKFEITTDEAFSDVMLGCAESRPGREDTWIDDRFVASYSALHRAGHAHSIEAWLGEGDDRRLVGGLYGVHVGGVFFAESKFSRPEMGGTDASKVVLVHLVRHLQRRGFLLLDVQFWNPHLAQFNVIEVPRDAYMVELRRACRQQVEWGPFEPGLTTG